VKFVSHIGHNFARESSGVVRELAIYRKSSLLFYYFRYDVQPATRENHVFELRRARRDDRPVRVLYDVTAVSQVQATDARPMLCEINYGKYLRGETRSFCIN